MADEMSSLERDLERLARAVAYPPAPPLAAAVRRRLAAAPEAPRRPWTLPPVRWALAAAGATALVVALALGVWAPGRAAVADFFDRIRIFREEEPPAGVTATPPPAEIVGEEVSITEAEGKLGFALRQPSYPDGLRLERTLLQEFRGFSAVALFYEGPSGLDFALFETNGAVGKGLGPDATASPVAGLGGEAYWLEGRRTVAYYNAAGDLAEGSQRSTDTNTLIWDEGGHVFRLEGDLSPEEALRIAQSLR
ncbi:MAG TPA: DUF4367 domain-containing protein [Dehalococcoidia bacterium]|nr:DUF4367 domain-containing protein [Dehalococcoidia bacterium]